MLPRLTGGRISGAASGVFRLGRRSSQLPGRLALRALERASDLADRLRDLTASAPPGPEAFVAPTPMERPGVIREVTEYVRRTIVSEPRPVPAAAPPPPEPAPVAPPGPSPHVRHLSTLVERWLMQLRRYRDFSRHPDPVEAVHDLRVASRRLRAFIDAFEPFLPPKLVKRARRPLRQVTRAVGALREWDVHAQKLGKRLRHSESDAERAALEYLLDRIDVRRNRERRRARARLERIDFDAIAPLMRAALDQLAERAASPSTAFETIAQVALEEAIDRVGMKRVPEGAGEDVQRMHRLRIAAKRLRYTVEMVKPALGESYRELHQRAKGLQDVLGDHHDRVVLEELVTQRQAKLEARGRDVLVRGLSPVLAAVSAERHVLYEEFAALPFTLEPAALKGEARAALLAASEA